MIQIKFKKICKCCGLEFETNIPQKLFCNREHWIPCPVCGKPVKKTDRDFTKPPKCCSGKCSHELRMRNLPKHICKLCGKEFTPKSGVGLICPDTHYRTCPVCGKEFIVTREHIDTLTCSKECQWEHKKQTCIEKYGADHPMKTPIGQLHFHQAMKRKYGKEHALQIESCRQKQVNTNMERYDSPYFCTTQECVDKQTEKSGIISKINLQFAEALKNANIEYRMEKKIGTKSFDFEIVGENILIEIDPAFSHAVVDTFYEAKDKYYHRDKSKLAENAGYRCIHIWDWDDWYRVIPLLAPRKRVYARKCKIVKLFPKIAIQFVEENHIQGSCRGQSVCFGLVHEDELVQVMTFGRPRYDKKYDVELLRLCTKQRLQVVGGASKLFKFAMEYIDPDSVISYCDISKFSGDVYEKLDMNLIRTTPPQEIWSKGKEYVTANLLRQRGYDQLFKTDYGKGVSNEQLMLDNGWLPVFDCGQQVWEYKKS